MKSGRFYSILTAIMFLLPAACRMNSRVPQPQPQTARTVRCAVIGGMTGTGMWQALSMRFEQATGYQVEVVVTGPKRAIAPAMRQGQVDLLTMHASDAIINLVADGYALDPQPWARNDLVIAGPPNDPAGIRGSTDAGRAMRMIIQSRSPFVIHQSLGAQEVLNEILHTEGITLDPETTLVPVDHPGRHILEYAAKHHAYTLIGRIPFLSGKMPRAGLELMVQGDPHLRRPYVVVVANPARWPDARYAAAQKLARYLCNQDTQTWLADFGRGKLDNHPLFFPLSTTP